MLENILFESGYLGLFLASFIESTLIPFATEPIIVLMIFKNFNPYIIIVVGVIGGYFGSLINYHIGKKGMELINSGKLKIKEKTLNRAKKLYERWGAPILFFSWVPIIGDPLTIIPGIFHLKIRYFTFWVILGKTIRYAILVKTALLLV